MAKLTPAHFIQPDISYCISFINTPKSRLETFILETPLKKKPLLFDIVVCFLLLQTCEMSTVKLSGLWLNRQLIGRGFNRRVVGNTRINDYEAPSYLLRPRRDFGSVSEKEADVSVGRKRNLRAVDVAEKLRGEKEKKVEVTNKVG